MAYRDSGRNAIAWRRIKLRTCARRGALSHSEAPLGGKTAVTATRRHSIGVKHASGEPLRGLALGLPLSIRSTLVSYGISLFIGPTIVVRSPHGRANVPRSIPMDPTITSCEIFEKIKQEHDALREKFRRIHDVLAGPEIAAEEMARLLREFHNALTSPLLE